jgi:hypothetical protein
VGCKHYSKELFEQLIYIYAEHLHELAKWLPPVQMSYMNTHELHRRCRPRSTCNLFDPENQHQALANSHVQMSGKTDHVGVTTMERLGQGHPHPLLEDPRLTCPGLESNPSLHGGKPAL